MADQILQPVLRFFGLHWEPSSGVTPYLMALTFTVVVTTNIAIKQVITGRLQNFYSIYTVCLYVKFSWDCF